jgi:membrane protein implicated in regulation of membrane protease activity
MIMDFIARMGGWSWFLLGLVLLIGEVVVPGVMLVWFGLAALIVGAITVVPFLGLVWWGWQAQLAAFAVLSLLLVLLGQRFMRTRHNDDPAAKMNQPLQRMIGREALLVTPLFSGDGKVRLGDTVWRATGPDLDEGSRVKVVAVRDEMLVVEPVA